jgi:hypothetical protein
MFRIENTLLDKINKINKNYFMNVSLILIKFTHVIVKCGRYISETTLARMMKNSYLCINAKKCIFLVRVWVFSSRRSRDLKQVRTNGQKALFGRGAQFYPTARTKKQKTSLETLQIHLYLFIYCGIRPFKIKEILFREDFPYHSTWKCCKYSRHVSRFCIIVGNFCIVNQNIIYFMHYLIDLFQIYFVFTFFKYVDIFYQLTLFMVPKIFCRRFEPNCSQLLNRMS